MPYKKLVIVYFPNERRMLHAQGIWIDKGGNQLPVCEMSAERLSKLVNLLTKWASKEPDPYDYLRKHPLFTHVLLRIREVGIHRLTVHACHFENAYKEMSHVLHRM